MNTSATRWIVACSFALTAAGFLLPWWPLSILGIALAALSGRWIFAIAIGLLLDIAYGTPAGYFHFLYFPFTILAVVLVVVRILSVKYLIKSGPPEHL